MRRRRILHLITGLNVGGTEMMLLKTLPLLQERFENRVCCLREPGPVGEQLVARGVPVDYLEISPGRLLPAILRFGRICREFQPEILVTYLIHADLFGRLFGRWYGIRKIVCSKRGSLQSWAFLLPIDRLSRFLVTLYTTQTKVARQELIHQFHLSPKKVRVIPNAIPPESTSVSDRATVRKKLGIPLKAPVLICVASLVEGKGQALLLDSFRDVLSHYPDAYLLLVGDGPLRLQLEEKASASVRFLGRRSDVEELLRASDLFVFPSEAEGMSNALLEGMAAGLPCLAADIPVNREVITDGQDGQFFVSRDGVDLTAKLLSLLASESLRHRLGKRAAATVRERFSLERVIGQLSDLLDNL